MSNVTSRAKEVKQPKGGYIKPSTFERIVFDDGISLNIEENVHGSIIGMAVDYLTRFIIGADLTDAFKISLEGADFAEKFGRIKSKSIAMKLLKGISGLDDDSIVNACKLVTFDVWRRNPASAMLAKGYKETNPDKATIYNIQTLIKRSVAFFEKYGPVTSDGFTFEPVRKDRKAYSEMILTGKGSYGGYTPTVSSGDGDFLTNDTLWDFKVMKSKPTTQHTLQLLMYWIMGKHSGREKFKKITKLGIFNPRLNTVYLLDISEVSDEIIEMVENEVICY